MNCNTRYICEELFRSPEQHDAHEFLNFFLNAIADHLREHQERRRELESSISIVVPPPAENIPTTNRSSSSTTTVPVIPLPTMAPKTWIHSLFEGTLVNETKCMNCDTITKRYEPFLDLSVDVPHDHCSLTHCLRAFSLPETLGGRNKFHCENCNGLQEAQKRCSFAHTLIYL